MGQTLARRIAGGYVVLFVSLFLVVITTIAAGVFAQRAGEDMIEVSIPRIRLIRDLGKAVERMRVGTIRLVDEPASRVVARAMVWNNAVIVRDLIDRLAALERTPAEQAVFDDLRKQFDAYRQAVARMVAAAEAGRPAEARAMLGPSQLIGEQVRLDVERYGDLYLDRIDEARAQADQVLQSAALLAVALALGSAFIAFFNWRREARDVVAPLLEVRVAMDALSRGGAAPATHPAAARTIEVKALQDGYNRMAQQIRADARELEAARDLLEARVAEQTAELRANAERLAGMVAELRAMDKVKSDFMAVVSHELLTPINFISGFGSALEDGLLGPLNPAQADAVRKLMGGADRLTRMVRNTLDYTKALSGGMGVNPTELDLAALVAGVAEEARPGLEARRQALTVDLQGDLPAVWADPDRVAQVLDELLRNASAFSPPDAPIAVRVAATPDAVITEVADRGPGLDEESVGRLFEPFFQVDGTSTREHGGLGLGLAVARHLVAAMGGTLGAASRPGEGARFWFTLPLAHPPSAPGAGHQGRMASEETGASSGRGVFAPNVAFPES